MFMTAGRHCPAPVAPSDAELNWRVLRRRAGSSTPRPNAAASEVTYESDGKYSPASPARIRRVSSCVDGGRYFLLQPGAGAEILFARPDRRGDRLKSISPHGGSV